MILYLGSIRKGIINITVRVGWLDRQVNRISNTAHRILGERYTPRLTRDMYLLYQRILNDQTIEFRDDGIYREGLKVISNPLGKYFVEPLAIKLDSYSPEVLAKYARCLRKILMGYEKQIGDTSDFIRGVLPTLLEKTRTPRELHEWSSEAKALVLDYKQKFDNPRFYIKQTLPKLIEKVKSIEELRAARDFIIDVGQEFGELEPYMACVEYALLFVLDKNILPDEIKKWGEEIKIFISITTDWFNDRRDFVENVLSKIIKKSKSPESLKIVRFLILNFSQKFGYQRGFVEEIVPEFIGKAKSIEELRAARDFMVDVGQEFREPQSYMACIKSVLPVVLDKNISPDEIKKWGEEIKIFISVTTSWFDNRKDCVENGLPNIIKNAKSLATFCKARDQIFEFAKQFGYHRDYIEIIMPIILKKAESEEEIEEWNEQIIGFLEDYFEIYNRFTQDFFTKILPELLNKAKNLIEFMLLRHNFFSEK